MVTGSTKRIVIIKDIPSNMIEEAILILKSDVDLPEAKKGFSLTKNKKKDSLIKEAELIINNYIKNNQDVRLSNKDLNLKPYRPKRNFLTNIVINTALVGSIAVLLFLFSKML